MRRKKRYGFKRRGSPRRRNLRRRSNRSRRGGLRSPRPGKIGYRL